jgi:hypothetical protein
MGPAGADASRGPRSPLLCRVRPPPGPGWWVCVWVPTTGPQATATRSASQPNLARWMDGSTWRRRIGRCVVALRAHAGSSLYCIYDVCVCGNIYIYIYIDTHMLWNALDSAATIPTNAQCIPIFGFTDEGFF